MSDSSQGTYSGSLSSASVWSTPASFTDNVMEMQAAGGLFWLLNLRQRATLSGAITTLSVPESLSLNLIFRMAIYVSADNQTFGINTSERPLHTFYTAGYIC